jgi:hypothetical protein
MTTVYGGAASLKRVQNTAETLFKQNKYLQKKIMDKKLRIVNLKVSESGIVTWTVTTF